MLKKIALLCLLSIVASCSLWTAVKKDVTKDIDCVKAEEAVAAKGQDVFHVLLQVGQALGDAAAAAVASGGDVIAALDAAAAPFIAEYGEPIVACVAQSLEPAAGSGSGSAVGAEEPDLDRQWIAHRHWTFKH